MDILQLASNFDYTLNPDQALHARVGSGGTLKDLTLAGTVNVIATADADLSSVKGIDNIQLTTGKNYTLTPAEAAIAKFGSSGKAGELVDDAGTVTLFVGSTMPNGSLTLTGVDLLEQVTSTTTFLLYVHATNSSSYSDYVSLVPLSGIGGNTDSAGTSASLVDAPGEWKFDSTTHVLSVWDGTAVQSIVLAGVATVTVNGTTGIFTIT